MATSRKSKPAAARKPQVQAEYSVHRKKVVWVEAASAVLVWLLFIAGLLMVFYLRGSAIDFSVATNMIIVAILFLSLVPFIANWDYYNSIWAAWREGNEITYKEPAEESPYSLLGNREVWIKNKN